MASATEPPTTAIDTEIGSLEREVANTGYFALPVEGSLVSGKYRIDAHLGEGGMGTVYSATCEHTGKRFALKWLRPELSLQSAAVRRFQNEARMGGRIEHPNVVTVYDLEQHGNAYFLVMELLYGETLAERLKRVGKLSVRESCALLISMMRGVDAVHRANVIHRDLKPQNIMITGETAVVLDFGVSKFVQLANESFSWETHQGTLLGTPDYMAPEQHHTPAVDKRADVYSLGVIAYRMLSGRLPHSADNYVDLRDKVLGEPAPALNECDDQTSSELAALIAKAIAKSPSKRFPSVEAFALALEPFAGGARFASPTTAQATVNSAATRGENPRPRAPQGKHGALRAVLGLSGLVLLSIVLWSFVRGAPAAGSGGSSHRADPEQRPPAAVTSVSVGGESDMQGIDTAAETQVTEESELATDSANRSISPSHQPPSERSGPSESSGPSEPAPPPRRTSAPKHKAPSPLPIDTKKPRTVPQGSRDEL